MQYTITQRQQHVPMKQMSHFREALSLIYREYGAVNYYKVAYI